MGLFSFLRKRRRERILAEKPLGDGSWEAAMSRRAIFGFLDDAQRARLRDCATIFAREKQFIMAEGPDGEREELDEGDLALVSAMAALPVLELGIDSYRGWSSVVLRPEGFVFPKSGYDASGVVSEYEEDSAGLVLETGTVVLSLEDVREAGRGTGYNVVIHEMAHKLDGLNGELDGQPDLDPERGPGRAEWAEIFGAAYGSFARSLESRGRAAFRRGGGRRGRRLARPSLDPYAAEDPPEFFAVCCEHFFETPARLRAAYPEAYGLLARYFRVDPLGT